MLKSSVNLVLKSFCTDGMICFVSNWVSWNLESLTLDWNHSSPLRNYFYYVITTIANCNDDVKPPFSVKFYNLGLGLDMQFDI